MNTGVNSTCKACLQSSRECTYPPPSGLTSGPKRSEVSGARTDDGESKKRVKESGRKHSARTGDPLASSILTRRVWDELYDIFKLHFSTEMPFLHPPTFRNRMRQASFPRDPNLPAADLQDGKLLLLGVLTLTARFHPDLVAYHSQSSKAANPLEASEYYATALKTAFGPTGAKLTSPSLDGIQALLMLGLYEWGQTRGLSAWVYVGIAIRLAQSMALAYEDDPHSRTHTPKSSNRLGPSLQLPPREEATEKEVKRRTLWSCFIMDRMLSAGKFRPNMISVETLRVQLPCSDDQFLFVHNAHTGFLNSDWLEEAPVPSKPANEDGVLSSYIRLVEIFGRFSEWSYAGGRRTEKLPPWDESTQFYQLRRELGTFHDALPPSLTFTEANLSAHIEKRNATAYTSMHTLYSLCVIMLHREYIPFIALRCEQPQGPLDEPTFPKDKFQIPPGFWEDSAARMFQAARDIVEIVKTCQDNNALPESPQIGFAIWQAAFVCVYAAHFPHMDTAGYLCQASEGSQGNSYDAVTVKLLKDMIPRLQMAKGYVRSIKKMHDYFQITKHDFYNRFQRKPFGWSGTGGGLEQYKLLEKELKEFGSLEDMDRNIPSDGSDVADQVRSRASTNDIGQGSINGEAMQGIETAPTPRQGAWAAVNAPSPNIEPEDRSKYTQAPGYQYNTAYQHSPVQNSNPPSLISPSNGDSTSGLNSPQVHGQSYQTQHIANYSPIAQTSQASMGPPNPHVGAHGWTDDQNEQWLHDAEQITMSNGGFDNYVQDDFGVNWNGNGTNFFDFLQHPHPSTTTSTY